VFHLVLVEPQIPPNTGNVIRLCANTGVRLHLVGPLGFSMSDRQLRRAGLDYHEWACVQNYADWSAFWETTQPSVSRAFALTTRGITSVYQARFQPGDWLVLGSETAGLPESVRAYFPPLQHLRLPLKQGQRSLNLSNAATAVVFEAWRQNHFQDAIV
jgi:tRNA (cytidine/uridine-2'-O-)-methyltransferase